MTIELILFIIISVGFIAVVAIKSKQWASALQHLYVRATHSRDWYYFDFSKPWIRVLMRAGLIFLSVVIALWAFALCFGTIYVTRTSTGQTEWSLQH